MHTVIRWVAFLALLPGCTPKARPPATVEDLQFPVAVIFGNASVVLYADATELGTMQMGHLNAVTGPPPLIDSGFAIYTLTKLGSTHNGLWLIAHPTGPTPVTFTLERAPKSGLDAARDLLRARLDAQTWRTDLVETREALSKEQTLAGMVTLVR